MTKTLTEQWHEGRLERGCYIIKLYGDTEMAACYNDITDTFHTDIGTYTTSVKEVLAPVPSYDEFVQQRDFVKDHQKVLIENMNLKRKLEIATKALKEYERCENGSYASKALALIKEVK